MTSQTDNDVTTYTIVQADGVYPDSTVEEEIFSASKDAIPYKFNYIRGDLSPGDAATSKPWTEMEKSLRDKVDGIMVLKLRFTASDLELFPRLKVLIRMGVGYDGVDRAALAKRGVTLCNIPDYGTTEVADHALALTLSLRRGILLHHDSQRFTPPAPWTPITTPLISRLGGTTFALLGLGLIGTAVALRAKAFGWSVIFYDPYSPAGMEKALGIERVRDLKDLFRRASMLSVHCPATPETISIVSEPLLRLMPRGAILINTARGEVVSLDAVEACLRDGTLTGVGLDVLPDEPLPVEQEKVHPLIRAYRDKEEWLRGRMVVTPHSGYHSPESLVDIRVKSAETMRDVLILGGRRSIIAPPKA